MMQDNRDLARARTSEGFAALKAGLLDQAEAAARRALSADPTRPEAHFLIGLLAIERKDWRTGIAAFGSVTKLNPADRAAWGHLALLFQRTGHFPRADEALARAIEDAPSDAESIDLIGTVLTQFGRHRDAEVWHRRAYKAEPQRADFAMNYAAASIFMGRHETAAATLEAFTGANGVPQAEWLYSTLKRATGRTRADQLMERASACSSAQARAFLAYAAGKDYEDRGLWADAFAAFDTGARAKRSTIFYDETADDAVFSALRSNFTAAWKIETRPGFGDPSPIFIVGQPRTGTTLVERIIASHSAVESAGELQQFGFAVRRAARSAGGAEVAAWSRTDPGLIGEFYIKSVAPMRGDKARFIDKLPRNFLHVPLVSAALPRAKIIHLTREPLDACFAGFKQLFADAYPHSYDQQEMARHFGRYAGLMDHWRSIAPGAMLDVAYERLVADVETEARRIFDYLELAWENQCLQFNELDAPVATASAVQVRQAVHGRSVGRAQLYGEFLAPMREVLAAEGLIAPVVAKPER